MEEDKRTWEVIFKGKGFSLNDFYSQGHYYKRSQIKDKYSDKFRKLIDACQVPFIDKYKITCIFNSRHDPSNIMGMVKVFEDALCGDPNRKKGTYKYPPLIEDDNKKFCKGIEIYPDESLTLNTFKFFIREQ